MAIIESIMNEIMKNEIVAEATVAIDKKVICNDSIFFDDKKENIEAAEKFGIKGVLFSKDKGNEILADFIQGEEL